MDAVWVRVSGGGGGGGDEEEELWRAATVAGEQAGADGGRVCTCVTCDGGEALTLAAERGELLLRDVLPPAGVDDLVSLGNLHAPAILDNLRLRFLARPKAIYTYCGHICVAVNPYEWLPALYSAETRESYVNLRSFGDSPPHIYAVAEAAYASLLRSDGAGSQSILVSGESGAGKTESVKIMIGFVAGRNGRAGAARSAAVAEAVVRSTPLLETFGNAKTLRNNNSSRFGKFTQLLFDREGGIVGSRVDVYLLEKIRVVRQAKGERNYHVFYQLLQAASGTLPGAPAEGEGTGPHDGGGAPQLTREDLGLPEPGPDAASGFRFLSGSGCFQADGIDDGAWYQETIGTMSAIGITTKEQQQMLRVVSAVMQIGQLTFEIAMGASGDDRGALVGGGECPWLLRCAKLLGCAAPDLQTIFETRNITARMETYSITLTKGEAEAARDSLAKALYNALFTWLVGRINTSTAPSDADHADHDRPTIGVLDIFGFESFASNSLEQLLINFANEKLQQQFTTFVFKLEAAECEKEGIEFGDVDFKDNQPILEVLDGSGSSLLALLDEETRLQRGSEETFLQKLRQSPVCRQVYASELGKKPGAVLTFPKLSKGPQFMLRHYAGPVSYDCSNFREKNRDSVHPDAIDLLQHGCSDEFVSQLFAASPAPSQRTKRTLGSAFAAQLAALTSTINSTTVHYVRCVKPNASKSAVAFDDALIASQLRCQGILESIRVARMAWPNRLSFSALVQRYSQSVAHASKLPGDSKGAEAAQTSDAKGQAAALLQSLDSKLYKIGRTKVFLRRQGLEELERVRAMAIRAATLRIQTAWRSITHSRRFQRQRAATLRIQRSTRGYLARRTVRMQRAAALLQACVRACAARKRYQRLRSASVVIQAFMRGRRASRSYDRQKQSAVVIAACFRRWSAERRFRHMREAAREEATFAGQLAKLQALLREERGRREHAERLVLELQNGQGDTTPAEHAPPHRDPPTPPAGVSVAASPESSPGGGWLDTTALQLGSIFSSRDSPTPAHEVETQAAEGAQLLILKRKLREASDRERRSSATQAAKIKDLQRRDLRASKNSALQTSMLHQERKRRADLEQQLEREVALSREQQREMEIVREDSAALKSMIRQMLSDGNSLSSENAALKARVSQLEQQQPVATPRLESAAGNPGAGRRASPATEAPWQHSSSIPDLAQGAGEYGGVAEEVVSTARKASARLFKGVSRMW